MNKSEQFACLYVYCLPFRRDRQARTQTEAKAAELESTIRKNLEFLGFGE